MPEFKGYLILDTETSGLPNYHLPADDPSQPRLATLAIILTGMNLDVQETMLYHIEPAGWEMEPAATAVNGLTTEYLRLNGVPVLSALVGYSFAIQEPRAVIAFNARHDLKIMRGELRRGLLPDLFESTWNVCAMRAATNACAIPQRNGRGFKYPKLAEACRHFNIVQAGAHTAMGDAQACLEVARALKSRGELPAPEIHRPAVAA